MALLSGNSTELSRILITLPIIKTTSVMASQVARTPPSPSWSSAVAGIWRSVVGSLLSGVLQYRSYSSEALDGHLPPNPEESSVADPQVKIDVSNEFSLGISETETFEADRPIYDRNVNPLGKWEGFRVYRTPRGAPIVVFKSTPTRTGLKEEERPVRICRHASSNVAKKSRDDSPRQGLAHRKQPPTGSARERGKYMPSAGTLRKAIAILKQRQQEGRQLDSYLIVEILKRCSRLKDLGAVRQVHDCIIQSGMDEHPYVVTTLLKVYTDCRGLQDARRVFDGLETNKRNTVIWNVMIGEYAKSGCGEEAYRLFLQMEQEGFEPDAITYLSILNASASAGALEWVKEVHRRALEVGVDLDLRVGNAFIRMYPKSGSLGDAQLVFDSLKTRDVTTWTTLIGAYAESGCGVEAYRLFLEMQREGFKPNAVTFLSILNPSASAGALEWVQAIHSHALKAGLDSDLRVGSALVHMYAKSGSIDDARVVFDSLETRDVTTWTTLIGAYAEKGWGGEAYRIFLQMQREGFEPNAVTYLSILNPSASAGALEWVQAIHSHALNAGLLDLRVGNALIHMYAKSGSVDDARLVFDRMKKRDVVTWNTMVGALAQHGCGHEALELFSKMIANRVKPDETSFVAVLSACVHAGFLDDGRRMFSAMTQEYGIQPTVSHFTCMVDLLGRAGQLEEAKLFIGHMPVKPDGVTWRALLAACRTQCNIELGELAAKEVIQLEPEDPAAYVLLSNIYAAAGLWEKVSSMRTLMRERGVRKEAGRSWIEVDNKVHEFVVGDTSHPEAKAIYAELDELTEKLKGEGYIPDTHLVLQDIDEEDKELALCSHSEKLAIAYGLLHIPLGQPIRIQKNLRVCSDCHTATKFISKVTRREIIARDASRFHHFKDGVCSCGDYW